MLLHNLEAVAVALILGALVGLIYSLIQPPSYSATARVMVIAQRGGGTFDELATSYLTQRRVENYRTLLTSVSLLDRAITSHGLPASSKELADNLTVGSPKDTSLIEITVSAPSPALAADFASAIAQEFSAASAQLEGKAPIHSKLVAYADLPTRPDKPRTTLNIINAALVGAVTAMALAVYGARTNPRLSYLPEISTIGGVAILGQMSIDKQMFSAGQRSAARQTAAVKINTDRLAERLLATGWVDQDVEVVCRDRRLGDLVADMLKRSLTDRAPVLATGRTVSTSKAAGVAGANMRVGVMAAATRWQDAKTFVEELQQHGERHALVIVYQR
ncbi:YveK family protein [Mycobacterium sp. JS623]|uniref:YveK family protein n=1 Tax=Mycobacterium sp. JS623 TaxID=212767 RepID=UPI00214EBB64|nr:Wzz/FepE/Etk N-terminal domain-containing protein [Mycobacterium sp. JS623]